LYSWIRRNKLGDLDLGVGSQTPQSALTLNEELIQLRKTVKAQIKRSGACRKKMNFLKRQALFSQQAIGSQQTQRMKFIAMKTDDGRIKGKSHHIAGFCMSADRGFISILIQKTDHGSIRHWLMP